MSVQVLISMHSNVQLLYLLLLFTVVVGVAVIIASYEILLTIELL